MRIALVKLVLTLHLGGASVTIEADFGGDLQSCVAVAHKVANQLGGSGVTGYADCEFVLTFPRAADVSL